MSKPALDWEQIGSGEYRAKVYGGWLIKIMEDVAHDTRDGIVPGWDWRPALAFIPDPNHAWELEA